MVRGLHCSVACVIFLGQGSNPCLLYRQADSLQLSHQPNLSSALFPLQVCSSDHLGSICNTHSPCLLPSDLITPGSHVHAYKSSHSSSEPAYMLFPWWLSEQRIHLPCRSHRRLRFDPWVRKIPWRRKWQPTPVFLRGKSHAQRSLVGYSPWGRKESDMTEQWLHTICIYAR